ncbi:response regulator transcription factor [Helicovermis profundi]|uniref:Stage 0 sporulation protein A homolog n=1 Tax=Helicovermis profundi TaxID=3065157 RepID=A0AAU9EQ55_9FIRM|nr:response regulator transcription factor [Clostridia bacterium S502]
MNTKILIADDEIRFRKLVYDFLTKEGYEVITAKDGKEAIEFFLHENDINLVILDVMMPYFTGFEVCKEIRRTSKVPILMLTALGGEVDEINGLNLGADEYITKPFSYEIFMARVNSLLRRTNKISQNTVFLEGISINDKTHEIIIDEKIVEFSPKEYKFILYLVKNLGRALSREQILNNVWGYDFYGDIRTVDTHIKSIRSKFGKYGEYIQTIRSVGYKLEVKK